jgi:hypothetical protein
MSTLLPAGSRDWAIAHYYSDILDHLGRSVEAEAAGAWEQGRRLGDAITIAYGAWALGHSAPTSATSPAPAVGRGGAQPGQLAHRVSGQEFLAFGADCWVGSATRRAYAYRERVALRSVTAARRNCSTCSTVD